MQWKKNNPSTNFSNEVYKASPSPLLCFVVVVNLGNGEGNSAYYKESILATLI